MDIQAELLNRQNELLDRVFGFIKQLNKTLTAQDIKDALAAAGKDTSLIDNIVIKFAESQGIDVKNELSDLYNARTTAKNEKAEEEKKEKVKKACEEYKDGAIDDKDLVKRILEVQAETTSSNEIHRQRIYTVTDYIDECLKYDPSKDFMPPLFGGLAFPDGTTSYIGARTSRGKTTAMVNLTREALKANRKTLFITVEMSGKQIMNKLILSTAFANGIEADAENRRAFIAMKPQIDIYAVWKKADLSGNGANIFRHYVQSAKNMITEQSKSFILYDARGANLAEIIDFINSNAEQGTIIMLDYIQKMPPKLGTDTDSFRKVQTISYEVVNTAAKTNSVIIAGAQFNRLGGTDGLGDCFSDQSFREAGDIEQDAHNAIGLGWKIDKQGRFYEVLKTREDRKQGTLYDIDFEGGYSYMAHGNEIRRSDYEKSTKEKTDKNGTTKTETSKSNINPDTVDNKEPRKPGEKPPDDKIWPKKRDK